MKVLVFNGSPKGKYSITIQTVEYIKSCFSQIEFTILNVGQQIRTMDKQMENVSHLVQEADLCMFAYPVFTFLAPSQLQHFIGMMKEKGVDVRGKYVTQITTSKHFYDVTAHRYVEDNCLEMGMKVIKGLSADMDDLLTAQGQKDAVMFFEYVLDCMKNEIYQAPGVIRDWNRYHQSFAYEPLNETSPSDKMDGFDTVIVTNVKKDDSNLQAMIDDFIKVYPYHVRVINIHEFPFDGGCLGCFHCATDGSCIYKDHFDSFLRNEIQTASAIVYAFTIEDHSMGADFKCYDDRQFCNGHRTVTMGMPVGYLIHGDYSAESNLRMVIEGRCEVGHNFLAYAATNAEEIKRLSHSLSYALTSKIVLPQNFYGVGGMKIFRDLIYLMRGMMKADHKFYKQHGIYDFPQKKVGTILKMKLVGAVLSSKKLQKKIGNQMNEGMIAPYKKVIAASSKSVIEVSSEYAAEKERED